MCDQRAIYNLERNDAGCRCLFHLLFENNCYRRVSIMSQLVECVPNFSEGQDERKILEITNTIKEVQGITLLDVDPGPDTNRTVVTFVGSVEAIEEATFRGIQKAAEVIDMRQQKGSHPRMGATDVCPFVPVSGVTVEECVELSKRVGSRVGEELRIPVYLYENSAKNRISNFECRFFEFRISNFNAFISLKGQAKISP